MGLPQIVSFIFIYLVVVRPTEPQTGLPLLTVHRHAHGTHAAQRTHARRDERHLHEYDSFTDPATALACVPRALRRLESATAFQSGHRPTKSCMQSNEKFYPPSGPQLSWWPPDPCREDGLKAVTRRQCGIRRLAGGGRDLWHSNLVDDQNPVPCPTAPPLLPSEPAAGHQSKFRHERLSAVEAAGSKGTVGARKEWNLVSPPVSGSLY